MSDVAPMVASMNDIDPQEHAPRVLTGPGELVAAIPLLLGYTPQDSVVIVSTRSENEIGQILRIDRVDLLNDEIAPTLARSIVSHLTEDKATSAILVSYTTDDVRLTEPAFSPVLGEFFKTGLINIETWAVAEGRYFHVGCSDLVNCPAGGLAMTSTPATLKDYYPIVGPTGESIPDTEIRVIFARRLLALMDDADRLGVPLDGIDEVLRPAVADLIDSGGVVTGDRFHNHYTAVVDVQSYTADPWESGGADVVQRISRDLGEGQWAYCGRHFAAGAARTSLLEAGELALEPELDPSGGWGLSCACAITQAAMGIASCAQILDDSLPIGVEAERTEKATLTQAFSDYLTPGEPLPAVDETQDPPAPQAGTTKPLTA